MYIVFTLDCNTTAHDFLHDVNFKAEIQNNFLCSSLTISQTITLSFCPLVRGTDSCVPEFVILIPV